MERNKTVFVAALDRRTHSLPTNVAMELPTTSGDLFNVCNRLHQGRVADGHLWNPDGAKKMRPFRRRGLFESTLGVGTENAVD